MPGKYTSSEEKARILAWRQEKVSIKEICARSRRVKSTVMKLLASAKGLPPNKVPKHRFEGGRKKRHQTRRHFNKKGGAKKSTTDSPGAKKFASRTAGKCCRAHHTASPAKRLGLA